MITNHGFNRLCAMGLAAFVCTAPAVMAVSPYAPDADTLHLWHLDEAAPGVLPVIEATESVSVGALNLNVTNGASLMAPAYNVSLGGALNTQAGLDAIAYNDSGSYSLDNQLTGASGAFTYEALVYPIFDPSTSLAGRSAPMEIMTFDSEDGASTNRFFQFRLKPPASNGQWSVEFSNIGSYTPAVGSNVWSISEVVDDFTGDLSTWTSTVILDANGGSANTAIWQIQGGGLQLDTSAYDGIEQYVMVKSGVSLAVGEQIRAYIDHTGASQDIGLYVGGTTPVAGTRQDYVAVYARDQSTVYSRGFDGTGEYALSGGGVAGGPIQGVYIARTATNTYETGWFDDVGQIHVVATRSPTTPNAGDVVGVYADVRSTGVLGTVTNIAKFAQTGTVISPEKFTESFTAPLPMAGDHAAAQSNWYHVAVSYNGSEDTDNNLNVYWTKLNGTNTAANLIGSFHMTNDIANVAADLTGEYSIGNESRGISSENFVGLIDEVRVSDSAIAPSGFHLTGSPYAVTVDTLLLFHFDDTHDPVPAVWKSVAYDDVPTSPINLTGYDNPVFGMNAFTGFGAAVGFDDAIHPGNRLAAEFDTAIAMSNFVDAASGAFTFEAVIQPAWIPGAASHAMHIITAEGNGGVEGRPFQFRIESDGSTLRFDPVGTAATTMDASLPLSGPHAIMADEWYHVAIAYNGNESASNNVTFYWTRLDSGATEANVLTNFTQTVDLVNPAALGEFGVGNELRNYPGNGYDSEEFVGAIDEVRISRVARAANEFVFSDTIVIDPYNITSIVVSGGNATLTWASQSGVTYSILHKSTLTGATWLPVKTGIDSAGDGTTSDSVAVSGDAAEFFKIQGE